MKTDKKCSFVIPCKQGDEKFLKRCLHAILSQDYPNKECVISFDGENAFGISVVKEVQRTFPSYRIVYTEAKEPRHGAPWTRNKGFELSTGDIISYLDADSLLVPGGLRTWMMAFEDNPDVAFVYGGYRLNVPTLECYLSEDYDEYLLTTANYISGHSPLKREFNVGWREELKSLQDWDMWLRIINEKGGKGKYIRDITVITEANILGDDSITADGLANWLERWGLVRKLNKIPDRKICVASLGAPDKGLARAKVLDADFKICPSDKPHKYEMILLQGFFMRNEQQYRGHIEVFNNSGEDCKRVIQWLGSDVNDLANLTWEQNRTMVRILTQKKAITKHICNAPWLEEKLKEMGIDVETVYAPLDVSEWDIKPLPEEFTVGIYFTDGQPDVYHLSYMINLARNMPDVKFLFFGGYGSYFPSCKNMKYCGWEKDMQDLIKDCSLLLRITTHDGFPLSPVEFLLSGRQVIINREMKYMNSIKLQPDKQEWINQRMDLVKLIRTLQKTPLSEAVVQKAKKHYGKLLSPKTYRRKIYAIFNGRV